MQYISHETHTLYSGDRADWRDIPVTSEQPSPHHKPLVDNGVHTGWELDAEAFLAACEAVVDAHIDAVAATRGYRSAESARVHALSSRPDWKAEGEAFIVWADDVWDYVFAQMAAVLVGERAPPESPQALIAELPAIEWPS